MTTLNLTVNGLEPLGTGFVYEGWIMVSGAPVSTGRFNITAGTTDYSFDIPAAQADAATAFVLTIEPDPESDPAPAATKVLGGNISAGAANLAVAHMAALGTDFMMAAGEYLLQTPTTGSVMDDYANGIWFLDPGDMMASLMLPTLPAGWEYEGWVVEPDGDGPISTGRFTSVTGADSDGAGPDKGPDAAPEFPGQDFIDPARDLTATAHMVVISVEPEPDDSAAPFAIKPLVDTMVTDVMPPALQELTNQSETNNPTGSVMIE
jgi:hypothetical protein